MTKMDRPTNGAFKLNMQMLLDKLEDLYEITYFRRNNDTPKLLFTSLYYGQETLDPSTVYVAEAAVFDHFPIKDPDISFISVGELATPKKQILNSIIEIKSDTPWQNIYNDVTNIFSKYLAWDRELLYILKNGGGVYELTVSAYKFFDNPLYIHDKDFNILAIPTWVVGMGDVDIDAASGRKTVPLSTIQRLSNNPAYQKTLQEHKAQLWSPPYAKSRQLYVNIWLEQNFYCGRLLIREFTSSFKPSTFMLAEHFSHIVSLAIEQDQFKMEDENRIEKLLKNYYLTGQVDATYLRERLELLEWPTEGLYQCLVFRLQEENGLVNIRKMKSILDIQISNSISFIHRDNIYMVCNEIDFSPEKEQENLQLLEKICGDSHIKAGLSKPFEHFLDVAEYYRVAEKILEIGQKKHPEKSLLHFREYVLDYILMHYEQEFRKEVICSHGLQRLQRYDLENHTDYVKTLTAYLKHNCQQTATAQELYIHRSTLMYRLEKIQDMIHMDLGQLNNRLYLLISLYVMGNGE